MKMPFGALMIVSPMGTMPNKVHRDIIFVHYPAVDPQVYRCSFQHDGSVTRPIPIIEPMFTAFTLHVILLVQVHTVVGSPVVNIIIKCIIKSSGRKDRQPTTRAIIVFYPSRSFLDPII